MTQDFIHKLQANAKQNTHISEIIQKFCFVYNGVRERVCITGQRIINGVSSLFSSF